MVLSAQDRSDVRTLSASGISPAAVAEVFDVSTRRIYQILQEGDPDRDEVEEARRARAALQAAGDEGAQTVAEIFARVGAFE